MPEVLCLHAKKFSIRVAISVGLAAFFALFTACWKLLGRWTTEVACMGIFGLKADPELRAMLNHYSSEVITRRFPDCVFKQGQKSHGMYLINSGSLRLSIEALPGEAVIERTVGSGYLIGLPATFNGHPYSLTCEVVEDAELIYLSRRDIANLMRCESEAAMKLLELLSSEVQAVRAELARTPRASSAGLSTLAN